MNDVTLYNIALCVHITTMMLPMLYTVRYGWILTGVTIHRTGPHRATPDRTGSVPDRKWLIISLPRRIERRKTS